MGFAPFRRVHREHPYVLDVGGTEYRVDYLPAESNSGMFGGNSNWRGPIWFPMNLLLIRGLATLHAFYGDDVHRRVSHRFWAADDAVAGQSGVVASAHADLSSRCRMGGAPSTAGWRSSRPTRTGVTLSCFTSTSTATTAPAWAPATRPAGPACWPGSCGVNSSVTDFETAYATVIARKSGAGELPAAGRFNHMSVDDVRGPLGTGSPDMLGATPCADGVNFSLFSYYGREVDLLAIRPSG